ncbi:MAG: hypothetical protein ACSLFE_03730 [Gemmatimonadaceae bacterium]
MIAIPTTDPAVLARRKSSTEYARRRRDRDLAERMRRQTHCPRKAGSGRCGCRIEHFTVGNGRVVSRCAWCERRKAGICRDCPKPVEGRLLSAIRCATCKPNARRLQIRQSQQRNREEINARARARLRKMPKKKKAEHLEYKRLYRKANPDKVRAQKQRYIARKTPAYVEYHRRYNARPKRAQRKRDQRARAVPAVEPLKVQTPMPVRYARTGQRLCLTPECRRVVTHRKKICSKCRQLAVEAAKAALENRRGRGRRTDLEQAKAA